MIKSNSKIFILSYIVIFLLTRLINLYALPPFIDELFHVIWAQATVDGDLFVGLREGLRLTQIWGIVILAQFLTDPLLAARGVSVLSGLISGVVCYKLALALYPNDRRLGYIAALFYWLCPFALFHDRIAVPDTLLTMLIGIIILVSVRLWQYPATRWAIVLGAALGLAALTKVYAVLYYMTPILCWLFLGRNISRAKIIGLMTIVGLILALALLPVFIIGRQLYDDNINGVTVLTSTPAEFFEFLGHNLSLTIEWLSAYLTWPFVVLLIFALILIATKRDKPGLMLTLLAIGPLLFFAAIFTRWYPRYLLLCLIPLSVIFAWAIRQLACLLLRLTKKAVDREIPLIHAQFALQSAILLILAIPALYFDYLIITVSPWAPFPTLDKWQYFEGPYAGYGLQESAQFIEQMAEQYPKLTIMGGTSSLDFVDIALQFEVMGLRLYLPASQKISWQKINDFELNTFQMLDAYAREGPALTLRTVETDEDSGLAFLGTRFYQAWQIASFPKPGHQMEIDIYQWLLPHDFAIRWFQQGGDREPRVAWSASDAVVTASGGVLIDWSQLSATTSQALPQALATANVEYVLVNPQLINRQPDLFAPFMTTDGTRLSLSQLPPGWRLAFVYPDLNCQWCLFQLRPPDHSTRIIFRESHDPARSIELEGYDISATQLSPGESFHITLYWKSLETLSLPHLVFIHVVDASGQLVDQIDEPPLQGQWPVNTWRPGDMLADRHTLTLDSTLPVGDYKILIGLYNPLDSERMVVDTDEYPGLDNAVKLMDLSVK